ncbi:MAG: putative glycogen debranching enzyme [Candidatus Latescibacterota bacterium]|jgi:predicted glycogen debranching enzyme
MDIIIGKEICRNLDQAIRREWLETNGIGGFASSTLSGINTRRYHGLLVPATNPPLGRIVALSKFEETLCLADGNTFELSCNNYYGAIHPHGYRYLEHVRLDPFPIFTYRLNDVSCEKQVFMIHGQNATVVTYGHLDQQATLTVRPLIAFRDYHHVTRQNHYLNPNVEIETNSIRFQPYEQLPPLYIAHNGQFQTKGDWYYNFTYPVEAYRGLDCEEDLYCPGEFTFQLEPGQSAHLIASLEPVSIDQVDHLQQTERTRRKNLNQNAPSDDMSTRLLTQAADVFIVKRKDNLSTIIAGYPWFTDWGRDTMIALPGLTLVTKRFDEARDILAAFAQACDQGMIPNRFPDHGETPDYNSVDATLWYVHAIDRYLAYTGDIAFVHETLWPTIKDIIAFFCKGTRYNIHVDTDGLLYAGEPGVQLTWMDAKVGDWVVTPREGKPVEINALWYNALCVAQSLAEQFGEITHASEYSTLAQTVTTHFPKAFWNPQTGCLFDCIGPKGSDPAIRPNQIFALSLPHRMLSDEQEQSILTVIQNNLLTPYGLRSLAPSDPAYVGDYGGDPHTRDGAYHQGTVWGWLMGPFVTAWVRIHQNDPAVHQTAQRFLDPLRQHLQDYGLGQISEIFDGDPPHTPRGCYAQAWSVAETLRAYAEDVLDRKPESTQVMS